VWSNVLTVELQFLSKHMRMVNHVLEESGDEGTIVQEEGDRE